MADWIRMLFGMVSRVGRGTGVLDGVVIVKGEGAILGMSLGHPIVTNGSSQITFGSTCLARNSTQT